MPIYHAAFFQSHEASIFMACMGGYFLFLIIATRLFAKRMQTMTDFFLAGKSLSTLPVAITFVAAWFGAGSTIGTLNLAFQHGISAIWLIAVPTVLTCIVVRFLFARRVRLLDTLSMPEAIERHYGGVGAFLLSCILLASITTFIASQLVAAISLLKMTLGWSPLFSVIAILGTIIVYSLIGGFRAVVITDILQFICYTLGLLILWIFVSSGHPPLAPVISHLPLSYWNPTLHLGCNIAMAIAFTAAWCIAPEMWQRMSSTRSPEASQKATVIAGVTLLALYLLVMSIGMKAIEYIPRGNLGMGENVLVSLALLLPLPALTIIVLMGVLSAISSTIDSSMNVGALTLSQNLIHRYCWPKATAEHCVLLSRVSMVFIAVPAAAIAIFYNDLIKTLWISADIYASTMLIPVLGVLYWPNPSSWSGIYAMVLGAIPVILSFLVDIHWVVLPQWWPGWPYTTLMGVGLSLFGFLCGFLVVPPPNHSKPKILA